MSYTHSHTRAYTHTFVNACMCARAYISRTFWCDCTETGLWPRCDAQSGRSRPHRRVHAQQHTFMLHTHTRRKEHCACAKLSCWLRWCVGSTRAQTLTRSRPARAVWKMFQRDYPQTGTIKISRCVAHAPGPSAQRSAHSLADAHTRMRYMRIYYIEWVLLLCAVWSHWLWFHAAREDHRDANWPTTEIRVCLCGVLALSAYMKDDIKAFSSATLLKSPAYNSDLFTNYCAVSFGRVVVLWLTTWSEFILIEVWRRYKWSENMCVCGKKSMSSSTEHKLNHISMLEWFLGFLRNLQINRGTSKHETPYAYI